MTRLLCPCWQRARSGTAVQPPAVCNCWALGQMKTRFSFWLYLKCSWFTSLCQFQVHSSDSGLRVCTCRFFFRFFSLVGYECGSLCRTVSPCIYLFYTQQLRLRAPNSWFIAPTPSLSGNHVCFPEETDSGKDLRQERGTQRTRWLMESPTPWTWVWAKGDGAGQGSLARCRPQGHKESDVMEWLCNN